MLPTVLAPSAQPAALQSAAPSPSKMRSPNLNCDEQHLRTTGSTTGSVKLNEAAFHVTNYHLDLQPPRSNFPHYQSPSNKTRTPASSELAQGGQSRHRDQHKKPPQTPLACKTHHRPTRRHNPTRPLPSRCTPAPPLAAALRRTAASKASSPAEAHLLARDCCRPASKASLADWRP